MRVDGFLLAVALTRTDDTMKVITPTDELSVVAPPDGPGVTVPPEEFFDHVVADEDREAARCFYRKYIEVFGMPVVAADEVVDEALFRTREIVVHMLAGRPDIAETMVERGMYLTIIGRNQLYTDLPENRNHPNKDFINGRVRGTGGLPTSFGEENLLCLSCDRYDDESIALHEFSHTIDFALSTLEPGWRDQRDAHYARALEKGLFRDTYAGSNSEEYWAEMCQSFFDCNRVNNWNHGFVGTREQLKIYDPEGYEFVRKTFNLGPGQDWRYRWLRRLPEVGPPPPGSGIDPYYTKHTFARWFAVVGRGASDEALLAAGELIRRMFAYRHDVLMALIDAGVKLVVLGREESPGDLPELAGTDHDLLARFLDYSSGLPFLVVSEENTLGDHQDPCVGQNQVIRGMARAFYEMTRSRAVDPAWDERGEEVQQYELRVKRLDVRFGEAVQTLFREAMTKGLWKGTASVHGPAEYWAQGVAAYFDSTGQAAAPADAPHPISTREALQAYDPGLFALVQETMAYGGKVDWRFRPYPCP